MGFFANIGAKLDGFFSSIKSRVGSKNARIKELEKENYILKQQVKRKEDIIQDKEKIIKQLQEKQEPKKEFIEFEIYATGRRGKKGSQDNGFIRIVTTEEINTKDIKLEVIKDLMELDYVDGQSFNHAKAYNSKDNQFLVESTASLKTFENHEDIIKYLEL